jgi:DUF971 family protein
MSADAPLKLDLKKDTGLTITWPDGLTTHYSLSLLRTLCPCALCKTVRKEPAPQENKKSLSLTLLPGNFSEPLKVTHAEMVGNYAIRIDWSDGHSSGIYSWTYLRQISPAQ